MCGGYYSFCSIPHFYSISPFFLLKGYALIMLSIRFLHVLVDLASLSSVHECIMENSFQLPRIFHPPHIFIPHQLPGFYPLCCSVNSLCSPNSFIGDTLHIRHSIYSSDEVHFPGINFFCPCLITASILINTS